MKPVWIIAFALCLLASPISPHTPTPDGAAAQKPRQLPPVKVQAPREVTLAAPAKGGGSSGTLTTGYVENDHNTLKFGRSSEIW